MVIIAALFTLYSCAGSQKQAQTAAGGNEPDSSSATTESTQGTRPIAQSFKNVVFSPVQTTDTIRQYYTEELGQFQTAMISYLRGKNAFAEVDEDTGRVLAGKTLRVEPRIDDMRIASFSARFWGGALAGSSYMNLTLNLVDVETGQTLRTEKMSSKTNPFGAAWTMGATDKSLPMDMGKIVGEYLFRVVPAE